MKEFTLKMIIGFILLLFCIAVVAGIIWLMQFIWFYIVVITTAVLWFVGYLCYLIGTQILNG